jgi:hypothetical protein
MIRDDDQKLMHAPIMVMDDSMQTVGETQEKRLSKLIPSHIAVMWPYSLHK